MADPVEQDAGFGASWSDRQRSEGEALRDKDGFLRLKPSAAVLPQPAPSQEQE